MIILDGKKIADKIFDDLKTKIEKNNMRLTLAIVIVGNNLVIEKFVAQKQKKAEEIGIKTIVHRYEKIIIERDDNDFYDWLNNVLKSDKNDGVIIQLPLPDILDTDKILNMIPRAEDIDVLSTRAYEDFIHGKSNILPPVVGAIRELINEYKIDIEDKNIVVLGEGRLVGKPIIDWLKSKAINYQIINEYTKNPSFITKEADIIISGVGKPQLLAGDMVKDGVIIFDAGTSTSSGKLVGDIDFDSVSQKASYITPVPGGIGPLTVAILFENLIESSGVVDR